MGFIINNMLGATVAPCVDNGIVLCASQLTYY